MKVFNISDRQDELADQLAFHGQQNVSFTVGGKVITPGSSAEMKDYFRHEVEPFLRSGAACLDKVPEGYKPKGAKEEPKERKHVDTRDKNEDKPALDPAPVEKPEKNKEGGQKFGR